MYLFTEAATLLKGPVTKITLAHLLAVNGGVLTSGGTR